MSIPVIAAAVAAPSHHNVDWLNCIGATTGTPCARATGDGDEPMVATTPTDGGDETGVAAIDIY